jgi:hypothetical protein
MQDEFFVGCRERRKGTARDQPAGTDSFVLEVIFKSAPLKSEGCGTQKL